MFLRNRRQSAEESTTLAERVDGREERKMSRIKANPIAAATSFLKGLLTGGFVGTLEAPSWEMEFVLGGFLGAVCGAITAGLLGSDWPELLVGTLVIALILGSLEFLSVDNPAVGTIQ